MWRFGRQVGLTDEEIARIKEGPDAPGWAPFDAALLRAADELHAEAFISDATWAALSERYNTQQLMDVVFAVGQYNMVSMALNTFGVQLDKGVKGFLMASGVEAAPPLRSSVTTRLRMWSCSPQGLVECDVSTQEGLQKLQDVMQQDAKVGAQA